MENRGITAEYLEWREEARRLLGAGVPPEEISWEGRRETQPALALFAAVQRAPLAPSKKLRVPKSFFVLAQRVACHRDPAKWGLLYRIAWRLTHGEPRLLEIAMDRDVHALTTMDRAVRREVHKMRAFVRFREVTMENAPWFVAWFAHLLRRHLQSSSCERKSDDGGDAETILEKSP